MNSAHKLKILPSLALPSQVKKTLLGNPNHEIQRIVIDFSSPNIAKPFHFGHLKSTILGNFLANISRFYGHHVIKLNYVGDWGTQYGLLSLGLDEGNQLDSIKDASGRTVLEKLVSIYVDANNRAKQDEKFYTQARERFRMMDAEEDAEQLDKWRLVRSISLKELIESYSTIGLDFDEYEFESDYARPARELVEEMKQKGLVKEVETPDKLDAGANSLCIVEVIKNNKLIQVPILKSDGTTLYITRDLAAAIKRHSKHNLDKMLYVVGADQEKHFHSLKEIVRKVVEEDWVNNLFHVKVGKVVGMSSRTGKFLLLSKLIDEATERFIESTKSTPTSKVFDSCDIQDVGKQLAISSLFVYDMRNKRTRNYEFNWDLAMRSDNRSGLQIQGTYARLCSLSENVSKERGYAAYESLDQMDYSEDSLRTNYTQDAKELVDCLNEFSTVLAESHKALDPCPIVNYAFKLCRLTNRARRNDFLQVLREPVERISRSRLTLFECSKAQLEFIINLIGLKPLKKI